MNPDARGPGVDSGGPGDYEGGYGTCSSVIRSVGTGSMLRLANPGVNWRTSL